MVMGLTILPALKIGGMQLFRSEFSDRSEKYLPRVSQIALSIFFTYLLITLICFIAYWLVGMPIFQAVCFTMTTVSTAGFATSDLSLGYFDNPWIEFIAIFFMILGSLTLIILTRFLLGDRKALLKDSQTRVYLCVLGGASFILVSWLWISGQYDFLSSIRYGIFTVVTLVSTTGLTTVDYSAWGGFSTVFLFLLLFIGGCTGSTAGGIKIFRYQILFKVAKAQIYQLRRPHGVFAPVYNQRTLKEADFMSVLSFFAFYIMVYAVLALSFSLCGLDFMTSLSGSAVCIGNIGPGLGDMIGPGGNYSQLPDVAKWIFMLGMFLGRLELLTLLILFTPNFWRA